MYLKNKASFGARFAALPSVSILGNFGDLDKKPPKKLPHLRPRV
jgi:hypothetical protein